MEKIGEFFGFLAMFIIFSIMLFFILKVTHKIPESWTFIEFSMIPTIIISIGTGIREWLT